MNYTDKELIRASQIAYLNIGKDSLEDVYNAIGKTGSKPNYTLLELFEYSKTFRECL